MKKLDMQDEAAVKGAEALKKTRELSKSHSVKRISVECE